MNLGEPGLQVRKTPLQATERFAVDAVVVAREEGEDLGRRGRGSWSGRGPAGMPSPPAGCGCRRRILVLFKAFFGGPSPGVFVVAGFFVDRFRD
jgi:hypothetical protein